MHVRALYSKGYDTDHKSITDDLRTSSAGGMCLKPKGDRTPRELWNSLRLKMINLFVVPRVTNTVHSCEVDPTLSAGHVRNRSQRHASYVLYSTKT